MPERQQWFRVYRPVTWPRLRLVCFPHAGAGPTAYRAWADLLPPDIELMSVCYPGRQDRFGEPFASSVDGLAADIAAALLPLTGTPFALFGHSMGSLVAYETAVRLELAHGCVARQLFVSGRWTPDREDDRELHLADDDALVAEMGRLGNAELDLFAIAELRDLMLSVLRADYRLLAGHRRPVLDRISAPIAAYSGDRDPGCAPDDAAGWSRATAAAFTLRVFPGDHFYLVPHAAELVGDLVARLSGVPSPR
jgi:pyochelin biosynthetic protein PchC